MNPGVVPGKFVVKGTGLRADTLAELLEQGKTDDDLRRLHPELTLEDLAAVHEYTKLPIEMRRSFGAWAQDADELDECLEWNRQQRKLSRPEIEH